MSDRPAGLLTVAVGFVFCYQGFIAMRIVIAIWGALAGFALGASLGGDESGVLGNTLSWVLAIVLAVLFAAVAYLYYSVSMTRSRSPSRRVRSVSCAAPARSSPWGCRGRG